MKAIPNINKLAREIATEIVEHRLGEHGTWEYDEGGQYAFTEKAQDLFIELYEIVSNKLIQL